MPKVSIILPTYNGERFIKESIESVIAQTYTDWELIIVNDCSSDKTPDIIKEFAEKDNRIRVINNEINLKLPASLNVGFACAKGEYYTWTSDDNMYKSNAIEIMVKYLNDNPDCDLVSFKFDFISEDGEYHRQFFGNRQRSMQGLIKGCNVGACFMYRKEIVERVGGYDENMFCAEDYDYWCRIALNGTICYEDENLYLYRENSQSLTATKQDVVQARTMDIRFKYAIPLMNKFGYSKKQITEKLMKFYYNSKDKRWLELAIDTDKYSVFKEHLKHFVKVFCQGIFSVKNKGNHKVITILWIKIKVKRIK